MTRKGLCVNISAWKHDTYIREGLTRFQNEPLNCFRHRGVNGLPPGMNVPFTDCFYDSERGLRPTIFSPHV